MDGLIISKRDTNERGINHKHSIVALIYTRCGAALVPHLTKLFFLFLRLQSPHTECNEIMKLIEGNPPKVHTDML